MTPRHKMRAVSVHPVTGEITYHCPDCPRVETWKPERGCKPREIIEGDSTVIHVAGAVGLPGLSLDGDAWFRYDHGDD